MKLKEIRIKNNKTQNQISEYLGISQQHYSLYEQEKREIPIHLLILLCKLYNCTSDEIIGL